MMVKIETHPHLLSSTKADCLMNHAAQSRLWPLRLIHLQDLIRYVRRRLFSQRTPNISIVARTARLPKPYLLTP